MSRAWVIIKRMGRVLKFLFVCVILTVCVFMLWRIFSTGIPKDIDTLMPNEELRLAYAEKGKELAIFTQKYDEITTAEHNYGYFAVPKAVFIPELDQAQIVFRYNNSTLTSLATDYSLPAAPDREKDVFDVSLVFYIDLTPENLEDNDDIGSENIKEIRVHPDDSVSERTTLYSFYRYSFDFDDELDMQQLIDDGLLISVHAEFYYLNDLDYNESPYGALSLYHHQRSNRAVKISARDKKALTE
ncbi:MAG: hypothetical protein E7642_03490 [Ruminococcaceae bacterium]|nr:hypothetical protein [Oscillospiraceae bacterium]